jgi:hypothetical protein
VISEGYVRSHDFTMELNGSDYKRELLVDQTNDFVSYDLEKEPMLQV